MTNREMKLSFSTGIGGQSKQMDCRRKQSN